MTMAVEPQLGGQTPRGYEVHWTEAAAELLNGDLGPWRRATPIAWGPESYATTFRALWDRDALFLRFDAVDDSPWSTMTQRDDRLWEEEVVEIFLDLDGLGTNYAELEISPANVVCDLRMVHGAPNQEGDIAWNMEGLETRVRRGEVDGGAGWSAVARIPWSSFASKPSAAGLRLPPDPGDAWRFNTFRIKRPHGPAEPDRDVVFASWSDPGQPSFHATAAFRPFRLVRP